MSIISVHYGLIFPELQISHVFCSVSPTCYYPPPALCVFFREHARLSVGSSAPACLRKSVCAGAHAYLVAGRCYNKFRIFSDRSVSLVGSILIFLRPENKFYT